MDAKFGVHPFRRVTSLFGYALPIITFPFLAVTHAFRAWEFLAIEGMEKLPVVDRTGDFVDVISQSMLINFLWTNIEILGSLAELKVEPHPPFPLFTCLHLLHLIGWVGHES